MWLEMRFAFGTSCRLLLKSTFKNEKKKKEQAMHRISQATTLHKQPRGGFQHSPAALNPSQDILQNE